MEIWAVLIGLMIIIFILGYIGGIKRGFRCSEYETKKYKELYEKNFLTTQLLDVWMILQKNNIGIEDYLEKQNINSIAIYGTWTLGLKLYDQLRDTHIKIKYAIDKNPLKEIYGIETFNLNHDLEAVDAVIVTPLFYYDEIEKILKDKGFNKVIALDEILYELLGKGKN